MAAIRLLISSILISSTCVAQQFAPHVKVDYGFNFDKDKTVVNGAVEYTYLRDISGYYSAKMFGFTTGINYVDGDRYQIPVYWTMKRNEWNDVLRTGVLLDRKIDSLSLYLSWGHDHIMNRRNTDGLVYTIELYGKFNKYRWETGLRFGIGFVFDKYNKGFWYRNRRYFSSVQ